MTEKLVDYLLKEIEGNGKPVVFSQGDVEEGRENYFKFFQESYQRERMRSVKARTSSSEIYLD